jgi:hypothetical protein
MGSRLAAGAADRAARPLAAANDADPPAKASATAMATTIETVRFFTGR